MSRNIKFTIVTVCKNAAATIEKTIQSVISQTYENIEYILVDGQSVDGTLSIVQTYKQHIDVLISEQDNGIYNAMNKGIRSATGDIISFLNADDRFFNEITVECMANFITDCEFEDIDVYHGSVVVYDYQKGDGFIWKSGPISSFFIHRESLPHPATFYSRPAFDKNGLFDTSYSIAADYEWTIRALKKNTLSFQFMPLLVAVFAKGGISNNKANTSLARTEVRRAISAHFSNTEDFVQRIRKRLRRIRKRLGGLLFR